MIQPVTEADAQAIIQVLNKYGLTEQVACLLSLLFSHVVAACGQDLQVAEGLMQQIIHSVPRQWELTKGAMALELMVPDGQPRN